MDPTLEFAARILGEEQASKLAEEIKQSGVSGENFNFALMTRLRTMQGGSMPTIMGVPSTAPGPSVATPSPPQPTGSPPTR